LQQSKGKRQAGVSSKTIKVGTKRDFGTNPAGGTVFESYGDDGFGVETTGPSDDEILNDIQIFLDAFGLIPGIGEFADAGSAYISYKSGDYTGAGLSVWAMVPIGGQWATAVKLARGARKALKVAAEAPKLLPAARKIQAAWGVARYSHGGLMQGIEHIMYRHGPNSGFKNVSRFAKGTTARDIQEYVDQALRYGNVLPTGPNAFTIEYNLGRAIGTNIPGNLTSSLRIYVRDGIIQTAFPF